mmetsp:Transcript_21914/g.45614  ORF Transcript_21914/g.45614 Transcript_21914/m.45614 type:complete len:251 (-) Transcript_21914:1527-2279(-)
MPVPEIAEHCPNSMNWVMTCLRICGGNWLVADPVEFFQPRQLAFRSLWLPLSSFELSVTVVVVVRPLYLLRFLLRFSDLLFLQCRSRCTTLHRSRSIEALEDRGRQLQRLGIFGRRLRRLRCLCPLLGFLGNELVSLCFDPLDPLIILISIFSIWPEIQKGNVIHRDLLEFVVPHWATGSDGIKKQLGIATPFSLLTCSPQDTQCQSPVTFFIKVLEGIAHRAIQAGCPFLEGHQYIVVLWAELFHANVS